MYALPYVIGARLHQAAVDARRRDRTCRYLAWSAVAGTCAALMITMAAVFGVLLWRAGLWPLAVATVAALVAPVVARVAIRHVLVPRGAYRAAYYAGLVSRPGPDAPAYATCVAAWAVGHAMAVTGEAWVIARRDARVPLGDAEVVVTALLAAARGDAAGCRQLLRSVAMLVEAHPAVRELVGEWLACDAAERGAWTELDDDAAAARWPASPLTYLLEGLAACHRGTAGAPGRRELWARWCVAPRRARTHESPGTAQTAGSRRQHRTRGPAAKQRSHPP